jgi:hypothetical protein
MSRLDILLAVALRGADCYRFITIPVDTYTVAEGMYSKFLSLASVVICNLHWS